MLTDFQDLWRTLEKVLQRFFAEVAVATAFTLFLVLTRCYCSLFMQVLPFLYLVILVEIAARYNFLGGSPAT